MRNLLAIAATATFGLAAITSPMWAETDAPHHPGMAILGDLHIEAPMLRATPPNAPVAGGFVRIVNTGDDDDTLIAAAIAGDVAGMVQLHQMKMADGVMSMSEVEGGIAIPAGEVVTLAPGGLHIMLMDLSQPLTKGEEYDVTLTFAEGGDVTMTFPVLTLGEIRAAVEEAGQMDHGAHHGGHHGDGDHSGHHGN